MKRQAGFLCPLFSVPGNQGIGDLGKKTERMIDRIAEAGFKMWQILPIQMTGSSHSPYQSLSSYAGDPIYINIDHLAEMGLITQSSVVNCNKFKDFVDYKEVRAFKEKYFKRAYRAFKKNFYQYRSDFEAFTKKAFWLEEWTVFQLFDSMHPDQTWDQWEPWQKHWVQSHNDSMLTSYSDEMMYIKFLQFIFYRQWDHIVQYAHEKGLQIIGDVPFYVDHHSMDVWANQADFCLDEQGQPTFVAGCPPDYFSADGQRWGMPIYNFEAQKKNGYRFWMQRMSWMQMCFDVVRIDHFRAFDTYWRIPVSCPTAVEGDWIEAPGKDILAKLISKYPKECWIAEDLGEIRPEVLELEKQFGIYGMNVLLFQMESKELRRSMLKDQVVYTGTHDNMTLEQAYQTYSYNKKVRLRRFFKTRGYDHRGFHDLVCHYALDGKADVIILPVWDICGYKETARINFPGTINEKNWTWKLKNLKQIEKDMDKVKAWIQQAER